MFLIKYTFCIVGSKIQKYITNSTIQNILNKSKMVISSPFEGEG